ncbi:MAG: D-hexose-6-phosphate mutarotase [Pseudomonadales bacterium]|nr:D-hexose-6-phosphate mutarotase [Pseudomonadales bacterium]MDG1443059.1 D-hexose-6-phosphate mutarotase [Pseudomonadales bacterium]
MAVETGQQMQQLYQQFGELPGVVIELHKALLAVHIHNEAATATVFLQGAQLSQYQAKGRPASIWCSDSCDYKAGSPLRGGIPICWPWFGDFNRNPTTVQASAPHAQDQVPSAHGFVRNQDWLLEDIKAVDDNCTILTLSLAIAAGEHIHWPHATRLEAVFTISTHLTITFSVHNLSEQTVHFTNALHTYLPVADISQTQVTGLANCRYLDCLDDWQEHHQKGDLLFNGETDRIYYDAADPIIVKEDDKPSIKLHSSGSKSTVVWNPWIDKAERLSQFDSQDYLSMLCIETANIGEDAVELAPQQRHQLTVTISTAL